MAKSNIPQAGWRHNELHGNHKPSPLPIGKLVTKQGDGKGLQDSPKKGSYDGGPKSGRGW